MMQDGLQIAGPFGGGDGCSPHTRIHTPTLTSVTGQWAELQPRDGVQNPPPFFSPVQTGLPRELAKLLTRARSQVLCLLTVEIRLNGTIRRASHQSPGKVCAM
jgi:hypothetical protein